MKIGTPRIIGILLLVIAALVYFTGTRGWVGVAILGAILIIASAAYTQKMLDLLVAALSEWKTLFITALYDAIYWMLIFGGAYLFQWRMQAKVAVAQAGTTLTKEAMANPQLTAQNAAQLQGFFFSILTGALLLLVFAFIAYTLFRGLTWTTITRQKLNKKFLKPWAGLNAVWWIIWTPIFLIVILALKGNPLTQGAILFLLAVASYFTVIVHTLFTQTHKIGHSLANGLGYGLSKLHLLIVPYTYAFVIYIILFQLFRLFQGTTVLRPVSMLFVVLFIAWLRIYLYHVIKQFK